MKKYIIPALIMAAAGLSSCEDAIDLTPKDKPTYIDYFTNATASDMEMFTNPLYNNLLPEADDVAKEISDVMVNANLTAFVRGGGERSIPKSGSGWTWTNLRRINDFLEYGQLSSDTESYKEYAAVARFFRAYFYYEKLKRFGDVPWVDHSLASDEEQLYAARDNRETIMTHMIEDLDYAVENLRTRDQHKEEAAFRATKGAALALKARVCLYEGTFRKYHNITLEGNDYNYYLNLAVSAAEELMSGKYGKYQLHNSGKPQEDYSMLFVEDDADPNEYILARSYKSNIADNQHGLTLYCELGTHGRPGFTRKFVNTYLMKDGTRFTDRPGWQTMSFLDEVKDRDPRFAQTIMTPGYTYPGESAKIAVNYGVTPTGYLPIKWTQGKGVCGEPHSTQGRCNNDIPVMRYAEVLLCYAEAKAELGTLAQADLDKSVNLIRSRAGMPGMNMATANANPDPYLTSSETGYDNVTGSNQGVILEIRRERTIELAQEALRIDDLMRWHQGKCLDQAFSGIYIEGPCQMDLKGDGKVSVVFYANGTEAPKVDAYDDCQYLEIGKDVFLTIDAAAKTGGADTHGYINYHAGSKVNRNGWNEARDYFYPIPSNELSLNPNLKQNPGW